MSDEEIRNLCAEAMGWTHLGAVGVELAEDERRGSIADKKYPGELWCLSGSNDWWKDPEGHSVCGPCCGIPDPLRDDAQAMALGKSDAILFSDVVNDWRHKGGDLNRILCETFARIRAAK